MGKIKGVLIDVEEQTSVKPTNGASVIEIEDALDTYYEILKCSCIDIVNREIGGKRFDIVCDDEGLFSDNVKPSAIAKGREVMLVGNLFIAGMADEEGNLTSLSQEDCDIILSHTMRAFDSKGNTWPVVRDMDY